MAKAIDSSKHILAGLLILSFLLLILVASRQFMKPVIEVHDKKEGFKTAPTRAADCKCLPGYVPSKSEPDMEFLLDTTNGWGWLRVGNTVYGYSWGMYGLAFDRQNTKIRWISLEDVRKFKYISDAPKSILEQALRQQREGRKPNQNYRCQNLEDPADMKECY